MACLWPPACFVQTLLDKLWSSTQLPRTSLSCVINQHSSDSTLCFLNWLALSWVGWVRADSFLSKAKDQDGLCTHLNQLQRKYFLLLVVSHCGIYHMSVSLYIWNTKYSSQCHDMVWQPFPNSWHEQSLSFHRRSCSGSLILEVTAVSTHILIPFSLFASWHIVSQEVAGNGTKTLRPNAESRGRADTVQWYLFHIKCQREQIYRKKILRY